MMMLRTVELAFARFQATRDARALAIVFDRTAKELLRVAHHVAHDPSAAEDLVQATFLTAIEAAGSHERGQPVLPWLLGILANHARAARRRDRREPDLQRLRGDVIADVHAEVESRDLQRELAAAIARLPEAYRPVLRLWFEHGLEAHEIATALERPAGTVRAQISRGMEALRRLLPASLAGGAAVTVVAGNGLAAVRAKVLATCTATSGFTSALVIGGLSVLHHKLLAGGAALAAAFVFWFVDTPPIAPPVDAGGGERAAAVVASAPVTLPATPPAAPERVDLPAVAAAPADVAAVAPTSTSLVVRMRGKQSGEALRDIGVAAWLAVDPAKAPIAPTFVPTDAEGVARFDALAAGYWVIEVDRLGQVDGAPVAAGEKVERIVEIPDGIAVDGTVVDAHGQPASGASIVMHGSRMSAPEVAVADAHGRFRLTHVASGGELQASKPWHAPSLAHLVQGQPGARVTLTLQLGEGGRRIHGRVLDAEGRPASRASVAVLPAAARQVAPWDRGAPQPRALWLVTDGNGSFATDEVAPAEHVVVACFGDRSVTPAWANADARHADVHVELRSGAPAVIEGSVRRDRMPLANAQLVVFTEQCEAPIGYLQNLLGHRLELAGKDGGFRIVGPLPGTIVLRALQGPTVVGEARCTVASGETMRCDIDAGEQNPLTIRVRSRGDLPPDLRALLYCKDAPDAAPAQVPIDASAITQFQARRKGPCDVVLAVILGGANFVPLARIENVPPSQREVHFALRPDQLPVRLLRGRLVDALSAPISGAMMRAEREVAPGMYTLVETTTATDGTFAIGPLPAGRYTVNTGKLTARVPLGEALLTTARDEQLGDLVVRSR